MGAVAFPEEEAWWQRGVGGGGDGVGGGGEGVGGGGEGVEAAVRASVAVDLVLDWRWRMRRRGRHFCILQHRGQPADRDVWVESHDCFDFSAGNHIGRVLQSSLFPHW